VQRTQERAPHLSARTSFGQKVVKLAMLQLRLALLGPFLAEYDGRPLDQFRTRAVQALLTYLACRPDAAHSREGLMALLWPELPAKSAQAALRHTLYHLRQAVPEVDGPAGRPIHFILADRQTVRLNPDGRFELDVTRFEALVGPGSDPGALAEAAALYRGDFLAGFDLPGSPAFDQWARAYRAELRRRLLEALARLADHHLAAGETDVAERYARRQLAIDNLHEAGHRQLMRVLAGSGRRTAALSHYDELTRLLAAELAVAPSAETERLVEAIRRETLPDAAPQPPDSSTTVPAGPAHNLTPPTGPFVGRRAELAELDALLADPLKRLITITGPGGMGKTRLARAAARRQLAGPAGRTGPAGPFADGVYFVPLAGLNEPERLLPTVAETLGLRLERGEEQLFAFLKGRSLLLVLDNIEHLLPAAAGRLDRLLAAGPGLKLLVTSRERLRLKQEQLYPIQGLPTAADERLGERLDDAGRLFREAARRIRPDFQLAAENMPAVNRICRLVEGMPLAIELAAAWVDLLSPAEIAGEIQQNLDFLATDAGDVPDRHRSVRAAFDASWQRLAPESRQLLAQLAVFRGGFTRQAAAAVAGASLPDLALLANKSLLTFDPAAGRYHIHELLRLYAAGQLANESGLLERYRAFFFNWLGDQQARLFSPEQTAAVAEIQADIDNIHAAGQALTGPPPAGLAAAVRALDAFFRIRGSFQEGINLLGGFINS
jgi:predicted ATPase/DNA-binding SARP family transcriptional activator